jgi:hypothetical protein
MLSIPIVSSFDGSGIDKAKKEFAQLDGVAEKTKFAFKKALVPATAAIGALAVAAGDAVKAASDMAESQSKVNVIFGDGAKDIEEYAKTASTSIGQSRQAVMDAAGTFGTFGKAAGLQGKDLSKFSTRFSTLASDLASFNNTTPEEAINAIGSALRGEAEPMRKFGVLLNDSTLKQKAMELGIYEGSGALTDQQKILAAQAAIYEQTSAAQGDFERTSGGLANSQRIMAAQFADVKVALGEGLMPVLEAVLPKIKAMADWASQNPTAFKIIAGAIAGVAAAIVLVNIAMALNPFGLIAIAIAGLVTGIVIAYTQFKTFAKIVRTVINGVIGYFETAANAWVTVINTLIKGYNKIPGLPDIGLVANVSLGRMRSGGPETEGLSDSRITALASGGIVTAPTFALIGEAGPEAVVPLSRAGEFGMGGGINITVNAGLVSSPDQVGQQIIEAIQRAQRRSGVVFAPG